MGNIQVNETTLTNIIMEAIQTSLFDDGITPEQEEAYHKKKLNKQNAANKAAQTHSLNKQNKEKAINKAHVIARGVGEDLFGNKVSDEERKEAEEFLQKTIKKKKV